MKNLWAPLALMVTLLGLEMAAADDWPQAMGLLRCRGAENGTRIWERDLPKKDGADIPVWGHSGHPLVFKNKVYCANRPLIILGEVIYGNDIRTSSLMAVDHQGWQTSLNHAGSHSW